jgi:hypothetical protein
MSSTRLNGEAGGAPIYDPEVQQQVDEVKSID